MTCTQSFKRSLFRRRASSDPRSEDMVNVSQPESFLGPFLSEFRGRAKSAEPKQKPKKKPGLLRRRSKTVCCIKSECANNNKFNCIVAASGMASFLVREFVPKYNFVVLGVAKVGKSSLINLITTSEYKHLFHIDFSKYLLNLFFSGVSNKLHILIIHYTTNNLLY